MKAKNLALTAIICGASILVMNLTVACATSFDTVKKIKNNIQTEQLNQEIRDRNRAIVAISEHNKNKCGNNRNSSKHKTPPPYSPSR